MDIQILKDDEVLDVKNISVKSYKEDMMNRKLELKKQVIFFPSISNLKGMKDILEIAFQDTKYELIKGY